LLRPNPFGLFDALGNVGEWCADGKDPTPRGTSPLAVTRAQHRVFRGGAYQNMAKDLRVDMRSTATPVKGWSYNGFRVVRTVRPDTP
jgi:formylglycine-generating enzyme required for sulfatase activity